MARRYSSEDAKKRILSVCVKMFIEKGYKDSKMADIMSEADVTSSTFHNIFPTKDSVLLCLTEFMFDNQFGVASEFLKEKIDPVMLYALETSIQLTIAELNENIREIYVEAYTFPESAEYIYQRTSSKLFELFSEYLPGKTESDFYEFEIGSGGIMRGYMARPCDKYFTLKRKLERFLSVSLCVYNIPQKRREEVINEILNTDIVSVANGVMQKLFSALEMRFDFTLAI